MKIVKCILNIILSFVLVCLIIVIAGLNILKNSFLDKEFIFSKLEEIGFYTQVSEEVKSGFEDFIYQSGLPVETIQNLVSDEKIKNDINGEIESIYNSAEYVISTDEIKEELNKRIDDYVAQEKRIVNKTDKENISKFENLICNSYVKNITITPGGIELAQKYVPIVSSTYEKYSSIPYIMFVIVLIAILAVNLKNIIIMLKYIGISTLSAGMLFKIVKPIIDSSISIDDVVLFATSLTSFVQNMYRDILFQIDSIGLYLIIGGLTMIIIYSIIYGTDEKNDKPKEKNKTKSSKKKDQTSNIKTTISNEEENKEEIKPETLNKKIDDIKPRQRKVQGKKSK